MVNKYTKKELISKGELERLYIDKNMTYKEIAELKGFSIRVVQNRMKQYCITPRIAAKRDFKGDKCNFWKGGTTISNGYKMILNREHPRSNSRGYVPEHILLMEKELRRYLIYYGFNDTRNEVVHHENFAKSDNDLKNLKLMTHGKHISLHCKNWRYVDGKRTH
jgi:hypothetical protein